MSTKLNDGNNPLTFDQTIPPNSYTVSQDGRTIDLIAGDGPCIAIVPLVAASVADPNTIVFEESSDESTWSEIESASPIEISTPLDEVVVRTFQRTKRFVRRNISIAVDNELFAAVVIGQQKKSM